MFWIDFVADETSDAVGKLRLGSHVEKFRSCLDFWTMDDYRRSWLQGLVSVLEGNDHAALITSLSNPRTANFITWWPFYRALSTLHFQEHLLFLDDLSTPFDVNDPFCHVPKYRIVNDEGDSISEWNVPVDDIRIFVDEKQLAWRI